MMLNDNHSRISTTLVRARQQGETVDPYPATLPADLAEAYAIQDASIALHGQMVGGWKVGRIPDALVARFGAQRLAGPIFANQIVQAVGSDPVDMPILPGFAAVEAELMLQVSQVPPPGVRTATAQQYVSAVRFGIEIASSPFPGINAHGPAVTVSDFGNNFGLLLGPEIDHWRDLDLFGTQVATMIDGVLAGTGKLANWLDGPFGSLAFVSNLLHQRGKPLQPGDWISTGAISGVHEVRPGQSALARFGDDYQIACRISAFRPPAQA